MSDRTAYMREYRQRNRERLAEYAKEYRSKHRDLVREWNAKHYDGHKEKLLEASAEYRNKNGELVRERNRLNGASYRIKYKKQVSARNLLNKAIRRGEIVRPSTCEVCLTPGRIHGHHDDYDEPLVVRWLCQFCHEKLHHRPEKLKSELLRELGIGEA